MARAMKAYNMGLCNSMVSGGVKPLDSIIAGSAPINALMDSEGHYLMDANGNYITSKD